MHARLEVGTEIFRIGIVIDNARGVHYGKISTEGCLPMNMEEIKKNPMYNYLLLLALFSAIGLQGWRTIFNNFAVDVVGINGYQVGVIQSVREIPGFLTFLVIYVLLVIKEHRLSAISVSCLGVGIFLTGIFPSYQGLIFTTFVMSVGFHYFETTSNSLSLQYFTMNEAPLVMGKLRSYKAVANITVGAAIWLLANQLGIKENLMLLGLLVIAGGVYASSINPAKKATTPQEKKIVLKRRYWLFYVLNFLSGARRQIFVVFAIFMLVTKYGFEVQDITVLFIVNNIITYLLTPYIGKGINLLGERKMLSIEYSSMVIIFLGYAFIENRGVISLLYVLDNIFFHFAMGINTYFQKTAETKDIAPSMAIGFTINHISAVVIPVFGGMLWMLNWKIPFIIGAVLSVASLLFVQMIRIGAIEDYKVENKADDEDRKPSHEITGMQETDTQNISNP